MKSEARSCGSKLQHTEAEARCILREMRARNARTGNHKHHMNAYLCEFCGWFHIGHASPPKYSHYKRIKKFFYRESEDME